jgi:cysteine desulfuration protein SufE
MTVDEILGDFAYLEDWLSEPKDSPMTVDEILGDFAYLEDWEDRYRYLIELGRKLEPLPEQERTPANKVSGCASQVWLWTRASLDGEPRLHFVGDSDAHIVRGLIAILLAIFDGKTPQEIEAIDAEAVFAALELASHLSSQRSNGLHSMVKRIKADARQALAAAS